MIRKVVRIRAVDSPNVRRGLAAEGDGNAVPVPGVLTFEEYQRRRATWSPMRQCIGLDAEFYTGAEVLMFPPEWLNRAETVADRLLGVRRVAKGLGVDPAEGGDKTAMAVVDELGLIELMSHQTPNTAIITGQVLALMRKHKIHPDRVCIDRGGGGKEHADRLRSQGFPVRTVAFGEAITTAPHHGITTFASRREIYEDRAVYKNRRAEMYGRLRNLLDPANERGFGIPVEYAELRWQLAPIPLIYDDEGRLELLPKNKKDANSKRRSLIELIGHSPDEADALVLAVHACFGKLETVSMSGAF